MFHSLKEQDVNRVSISPYVKESVVFDGHKDPDIGAMAEQPNSTYFESALGVDFEPAKYAFVDNTIMQLSGEPLYATLVNQDENMHTSYSAEPAPYIAGDGDAYYYVTNHLGTPIQVYSHDGSDFVLEWEPVYSAYGEIYRYELGENFYQPIRFPGQYEDSETGLHYNWNRYYDPAIGGYSQVDFIVENTKGRYLGEIDILPEIYSNYGYGSGNPIVYFDSTGAESEEYRGYYVKPEPPSARRKHGGDLINAVMDYFRKLKWYREWGREKRGLIPTKILPKDLEESKICILYDDVLDRCVYEIPDYSTRGPACDARHLLR